MTDPIQAYPLQWPPGWKRTERFRRVAARFSRNGRVLTVNDGVERVLAELARLGIHRDDIVISSNLPTRLDGLPRSDARRPEDTGAAVYWRTANQKSTKAPKCMAIDRYTLVEDNLAAIAATLEAMRAIERHGGAEILDRAFTGFVALPAPEQWFTVLGVSAHASREQIIDAHRALAMKHHPDRPGGNDSEMARINAARDEGLSQRS